MVKKSAVLKSGAVAVISICILYLAGCSPFSQRDAGDTRRAAIDHFGQGRLMEENGQYQLAISEYLKAEEISPRPAVYYHIGHCYLQLEQPQRAVEYFKTALKMAPDYRQAEIELAIARKQISPGKTVTEVIPAKPPEKKKRQEEITSEILKLPEEKKTPETTEKRSEPLRFLSIPTDRIGTQSETEKTSPEDLPEIENVKKVIFPALYGEQTEEFTKRQKQESQRYIELKRDSLDDFSFHIQKAEYYRNNNLIREAILEYRDALKVNPRSLEAVTGLGEVYLLSGREERAVSLFEKAASTFPNSSRFFLKWGNLYLNLDRLEQAEEKFRKALSLEPNYASALNNLGIIEMKKGNYQNAAGYFEKILKTYPAFEAAHLNLGIIYSDFLDQPEKASEHYRRYLELGGKRSAEVRQWLDDLE